MPTALDLRRRIRSVRNTRQITKAMKMVSAARLRRAQERALNARPYAKMLTNVLKSLVMRAEIYDPETGEPRHPLLARRPERNALLIVVTGDRGLAGAFNANILKAALRFLAARGDRAMDIEVIGRKGRDFLRRRFPFNLEQPEIGEIQLAVASDMQRPEQEFAAEITQRVVTQRAGAIQVVGERINILGRIQYVDAADLAESVIARYSRGEVDAVYLLYNEFKSVIAQRLVVDEILPIAEIGAADIRMAEGLSEEDRKKVLEAARTAGVGVRPAETEAMDRRAAAFGASEIDYIYEQSPQELFHRLLPRYVAVRFYHALIESVAAEHAARMTAMDAATKNAGELIDKLTLQMNRVRQARITKEIIEIVSGAAAL